MLVKLRHLTQWALPEQLVHGSPGDCKGRRGLLHKRSFFNPQDCETLREFRVWLSAEGDSQNVEAGEVRGVASGPSRATLGRSTRNGGEEGMITPVREGSEATHGRPGTSQ